MRAYSEFNEEALRARGLLKDWAGEGFLSQAQYERMEEGTPCELRRTNVFLRVVLFLFSLIIAVAAVALFLVVFFSRPPDEAVGLCLLVFAGASYAAAEFAVSRAQLYRYGIEEALATGSVGCLCMGMHFLLRSGGESLVPAAGAAVSLWIWHRFGLPYAFPAAMIFAAYLPGHLTSSYSAWHVVIAAFYAAGLVTVAAIRPRYRSTYLNERYSMAEAFLWLGIYLAINLQLSPGNVFGHWSRVLLPNPEFPRPFYWATWVLTWCVPAAVLTRGVRGKDRFVIAAGAITATLTLVTNKPYLGWPRHSWDPMILGALLIAVAIWLGRWLAGGPRGIRYGFTARRLSSKDKAWMDVGAASLSLLSADAIAPRPQAGRPEVRFGGGDSGGGGASSDF